jgi:hypothetical protein
MKGGWPVMISDMLPYAGQREHINKTSYLKTINNNYVLSYLLFAFKNRKLAKNWLYNSYFKGYMVLLYSTYHPSSSHLLYLSNIG